MTPAERVASRKPSSKPKLVRKVVWICHLRERRRALKISLRDVSKNIGIAMSVISNAERGFEVGLRTAYKLAVFYGAAVEELWEELT